MEIAGMMDFFVYIKKKGGRDIQWGKMLKKQNEKVILYVLDFSVNKPRFLARLK